MSFRKVNEDDILSDLLSTREDNLLGYTTEEDKKQLEKLDENFLDYLCYWNDKFYRNGFVDGVQMIVGCIE